MRVTYLTAVLIWFAAVSGPAAAFETEAAMAFGPKDATTELRIISTGDLDLFAPLISGFQKTRPAIRVNYVVTSSTELYKAISIESAQFDVAMSSAMDLQTKLANDGLVQSYNSTLTDALPTWARWSNRLFAFTQEPAVLIAAKSQLDGLEPPTNRRALIQFLRDNSHRFQGRIGTYDPGVSGFGYLMATQDTRQSQDFWRLAEVMGARDVKLYCCSSEMIDAIETGEIALAYNVLGSYAARRIGPESDAVILPMQDYTHVMLRTALIPEQSANPDLAGDFIDFLLSPNGRAIIRDEVGLPPIDGTALSSEQNLRPIRLGPGLLVYLDQIKRENFLSAWSAAVVQP